MPSLRTLPEALAQAAATDCGYTFINAAGEVYRAYRAIEAESRRVARSLRDAGLRRGDLVALVVSDAEQFVTALYGASLAGVVPASLYPPPTTSDLPRYVELTAGI